MKLEVEARDGTWDKRAHPKLKSPEFQSQHMMWEHLSSHEQRLLGHSETMPLQPYGIFPCILLLPCPRTPMFTPPAWEGQRDEQQLKPLNLGI